jgi:NADPH-dependent 2,4-dienoyl-CoA reductase/sulfur reductase-like enzyme/rhodanese-related sulfurtransferase
MKTKKLLIVGGVAGGASAAARARRLDENAEIILFERGPDISFANCGLPYHLGGAIGEREKLLVTTPSMMASRFGIDVRTQTEVTAINRDNREVTARDSASGKEYRESYDALVLSPGAEPIRPPIPGIDHPKVLTLRNLQDMDRIIETLELHTIDRPDFASRQNVAVIGGGYIGLEMAEALVERGLKVSLVELAPQVMGPADPEMAAPLHEELVKHGIDLRLNTSITAFGDSGSDLVLELSDGKQVLVDLAILAIGVRPETVLAADAGLELGSTGGIKTDDRMRTSDPAIYAVGDAVEVVDYNTGTPALFPLAGPANRQGRIAADNICGRDSVYKHTQGTAICKVFNLAIGMTGLSEKAAGRLQIPIEKVYVHPMSHASYYPGAQPLSLKLLFDPVSGKVLGAQAVGADSVDKRIDVIAVAIRAGLTVFDLEELELSYAPPFGSAKDPVNFAGFAASNALRGDVALCHVQDVRNPSEQQKILDVRTAREVSFGTIPGAVNIPVDDLRGKLAQLDKATEWLVTCQVGLRGYLACRILNQNGYKCRNLTGGYKTWLMHTGTENE